MYIYICMYIHTQMCPGAARQVQPEQGQDEDHAVGHAEAEDARRRVLGDSTYLVIYIYHINLIVIVRVIVTVTVIVRVTTVIVLVISSNRPGKRKYMSQALHTARTVPRRP